MASEAPVARIGAVVLAAGGSSRLGFPKQLVSHEGEPLVCRAAAAAINAGATPVVVVLGANADLVAPALSGLAQVATIVNQDWETGLASSLITGLRALMEIADCDAVIVTLVDQPLVDSAALKRLLAAFDSDHRIVASAYAGTIGVPAVFGREHIPDLVELTGDSGAGQWLRSRSADVTTVPNPGAEVDIDTPSDTERLGGPRLSRHDTGLAT